MCPPAGWVVFDPMVILFRNNVKGTKKRIRSKRYQMFEKAIMSPIRGCLRGAGKAMDFIADMIG